MDWRVRLSPDQIPNVEKITYHFPSRFDLFHQLHCLNQIRQALHRDIYPEIPIHGEVHTGKELDGPFPGALPLVTMAYLYRVNRALHKSPASSYNVLGHYDSHSDKILPRIQEYIRED